MNSSLLHKANVGGRTQRHPLANPQHRPSMAFNSVRVGISPIGRKAGRTDAGIEPSSSLQSTSLTAHSQSSYNILEAFFYGRAFARTFQKKIGDALADAVADASKSAAERPQRIRDFQNEVAAIARQDMASFSIQEPTQASSSSSNKVGGASKRRIPEDPEATVDELRAEIAYCRASIQQMKNADKAPIIPAESKLL